MQNPKHANIAEYCKKQSLHLRVGYGIVGEEFKKARGKALVDACVAWNDIGGSGKHRIQLPAADSSNHIQLALVQSGIDGAGLNDESDIDRPTESEGED